MVPEIRGLVQEVLELLQLLLNQALAFLFKLLVRHVFQEGAQNILQEGIHTIFKVDLRCQTLSDILDLQDAHH